FSIDALMEKVKDDSDRSTVVGAVVEGSGSVVMTAFMLEEARAGRMDPKALKELMESEAGRAEKLKASPAVLQRSLLAPYLLGQTLSLRGDISRLAQGIHPDDIDHLFREPPTSTEQLLHPEKYWAPSHADPPLTLTPHDEASLLGEGWSLSSSGVLGELNLALLCGATNPPLDSLSAGDPSAWTNECAAGWGGDAWQL